MAMQINARCNDTQFIYCRENKKNLIFIRNNERSLVALCTHSTVQDFKFSTLKGVRSTSLSKKYLLCEMSTNKKDFASDPFIFFLPGCEISFVIYVVSKLRLDI